MTPNTFSSVLSELLAQYEASEIQAAIAGQMNNGKIFADLSPAGRTNAVRAFKLASSIK